jgi:hypothetical protein
VVVYLPPKLLLPLPVLLLLLVNLLEEPVTLDC